jgi:pimeloyl-ACP methyl ester carboxylesterase
MRFANLSHVLILSVVAASGCAGAGGPATTAKRIVVFVPGAGGDGPWYSSFKRSIAADGKPVTVGWGAPLPLFVLNFNSRLIHSNAELKLARRLENLRESNPSSKLILIGHSAGCGVALGALPRASPSLRVDRVILLAPSVSPGYDLTAAATRVSDRIHVFHSRRDWLHLAWRTQVFGTYDNVKSKAAGNVGFNLAGLDARLRQCVVQHAYQPEWAALGNNGDHTGLLSRAFAERVLAPLLVSPPDAPVQSFAENLR